MVNSKRVALSHDKIIVEGQSSNLPSSFRKEPHQWSTLATGLSSIVEDDNMLLIDLSKKSPAFWTIPGHRYFAYKRIRQGKAIFAYMKKFKSEITVAIQQNFPDSGKPTKLIELCLIDIRQNVMDKIKASFEIVGKSFWPTMEVTYGFMDDEYLVVEAKQRHKANNDFIENQVIAIYWLKKLILTRVKDSETNEMPVLAPLNIFLPSLSQGPLTPCKVIDTQPLPLSLSGPQNLFPNRQKQNLESVHFSLPKRYYILTFWPLREVLTLTRVDLKKIYAPQSFIFVMEAFHSRGYWISSRASFSSFICTYQTSESNLLINRHLSVVF